ncbi:MAG: helix-turn-helix domain-containing protein [Hoeflea sp.]|uniref:helix-turn-helix domain-containing protein n=1 Tax=Hoeflea sp. TaxID=1940281 RepID=UPI003296CB20
MAEDIENKGQKDSPDPARGRKSGINSTALKSVAEQIPDQNALIRFGISDQSRLQLRSALADENDWLTIDSLRSEMLAADGPISRLKQRYAQNPNTPQAGLFGTLTAKYNEEISKDPRAINFAVLYARGARFYAARVTADRQVSLGEWPTPDADEEEQIEAICSLHGPLIMASAVGRQLVVDAHEYEATPETYRQEEKLLEEFGEVLAAESEIIEPETAEAISDLTASITNDPQPARSRGVRLLVAGSALITIVGGTAWLSAGGAAAAVAVPLLLSTGAGMILWEVVKKTSDFRATIDGLAERYDSASRKAAERTSREQEHLLENMEKLVNRKRDLFARVADLRPEFGWAKKYIQNDKQRDEVGAPQPRHNEDQDRVFIPFSSPVGVLNAYVATFELDDEFERELWIRKIASSRVLADLKRLGLVEYPAPGIVRLSKKDVNDPEGMFKHAVSKQESIQITREALIRTPSAVASNVCDLITNKLGKEFATDATVLRVGNALMRWTRWLEPHLIDPQDSRASILRATATASTGVRGRARFKTQENLNFVSEILLNGGSRREAAKKLGITPEAISNWIAEGIVPGITPQSRGRLPKTSENLELASKLLRQGLTYEEVGKRTGVKAATVKKWVRDGKLSTL